MLKGSSWNKQGGTINKNIEEYIYIISSIFNYFTVHLIFTLSKVKERSEDLIKTWGYFHIPMPGSRALPLLFK